MQPARLFKDLKPLSERAVIHALEALETGTIGLLSVHIMPDGRIEHRWVDGPATVQLDLWRSTPPPGIKVMK